MSEEIASYNPRFLSWEDIQDDARNLFDVWARGSELQWARSAWLILEHAKLTEYETAVDLTRVQVRLLTLAIFYWDFCNLAHDESWEETDLWLRATDEAGVNPFRVAQLVEKQFDEDDFDSSDSDLLQSALIKLTDYERPIVSRVLIEGFGSEMKLVEAMEASTTSSKSNDNVTLDLSRGSQALSWVMSGMHRI